MNKTVYIYFFIHVAFMCKINFEVIKFLPVMRKFILLASALICTGISVSAQTFSYYEIVNSAPQKLSVSVRGSMATPVTITQLQEVRSLQDVIEHFPVNWISEYTSTEVSISKSNMAASAKGIDINLTPKQRVLLKGARPQSEIEIKVHYKAANAVTGAMEDFTMIKRYTVVPEHQAVYAGDLNNYFKEHALKDNKSQNIKPSVIKFTVNEAGKAVNGVVVQSTGAQHVDNLLLDAINKMAVWQPARNATGKAIPQEFVVMIAEQGC